MFIRLICVVDYDDVCIGFGDEGICECYFYCFGIYYQVVGFDGFCWFLCWFGLWVVYGFFCVDWNL